MVDGVPRRVDRDPLAVRRGWRRWPCTTRRVGSGGENSERSARDHEPAPQRRPDVLAAAPGRLAAPRDRLGLHLGGRVVAQRVVRRSRRRGRRSSGSPRRGPGPAPRRLRSRSASSAASSLGRCRRRLVSSNDQVVNARWVMSSASASRLMRPAPPKWSGCECVTITVCMSRSLKPAVFSRSFSARHDFGPGSPGSTTARPRSSRSP